MGWKIMCPFNNRTIVATVILGYLAGIVSLVSATAAADEKKVTHSFFAAGLETFIVNGDGEVTWRYPHGSRDGWVLPNGNVLLALNKSKDYPGGAAVEVTRAGK